MINGQVTMGLEITLGICTFTFSKNDCLMIVEFIIAITDIGILSTCTSGVRVEVCPGCTSHLFIVSCTIFLG